MRAPSVEKLCENAENEDEMGKRRQSDLGEVTLVLI
jgi:hypothetical protein